MRLPSWAPLRVCLWGLERQRRRLRAAFDRDIHEARRQKKPHDDIESLQSQADFETSMIDDEMAVLVSRCLATTARRLFLPIPQGGWVQSRSIYQSYLTREAMTELRDAIARERRLRRENALAWIAPLTGLVGALTGLASILTRCRSGP
ncbi:MAG TPA: hypothetical protein VFD84_20990 [Candidatus Binatia bacterium]|nr:hypothetical protein [Candidatus Binatia bacterium]